MPEECQVVASGFRFNECPRWHDGVLYLVDMYDRRVCRIDGDGQVHTVVELEHPGGLGWLPHGDLLVVASHDCKVLRYDGYRLHEHADLNGRGLVMVNDMVVSKSGSAYAGGLGTGFAEGLLPPIPIFHIGADGTVDVAAEGLYGPNGMVITPDGKTLIVAESFASRLTAFDVAGDGSLSNRRIWASFGENEITSVAALLEKDFVIPDGIALDADGAVWVADARGGGASRVAEGGKILDQRSFGSDTAVAVALGGQDGRTLYAMVGPPFHKMADIFSSTDRFYSVRACPVDVAGVELS
jgi:sugar lactone lactonase YvrE